MNKEREILEQLLSDIGNAHGKASKRCGVMNVSECNAAALGLVVSAASRANKRLETVKTVESL